MPIPTLVGSAEAAKILEIGPTNFSHLRKKYLVSGDTTFPAPVTQLQCGPIWTEKEMIKFKKVYDSRRRRVRPTNGDAAVVETPAAPKPVPAAKTAAKAPAKPRTKAPAAKPAEDAPAATVTEISKPTAKKLALKPKAG